MERLDKNLLIYLALNMDLYEISSLCRTSKRFNEIICKNDVYWMNRFLKDYPGYDYRLYGNNYKEAYENKSRFIIQINITMNDNVEEDEEYLANDIHLSLPIYLDSKLPLDEIRQQIYKVLSDFFHTIAIYGTVTVEINGEYFVCGGLTSYVSLDCFDKVNYNTEEINVYFDSHESLNKDLEDEYLELLEDIIEDK